MACTGCMYLVGKEAICGMTYACAGSQRVLVDKIKPAADRKDKGRKKKQQAKEAA